MIKIWKIRIEMKRGRESGSDNRQQTHDYIKKEDSLRQEQNYIDIPE